MDQLGTAVRETGQPLSPKLTTYADSTGSSPAISAKPDCQGRWYVPVALTPSCVNRSQVIAKPGHQSLNHPLVTRNGELKTSQNSLNSLSASLRSAAKHQFSDIKNDGASAVSCHTANKGDSLQCKWKTSSTSSTSKN